MLRIKDFACRCRVSSAKQNAFYMLRREEGGHRTAMLYPSRCELSLSRRSSPSSTWRATHLQTACRSTRKPAHVDWGQPIGGSNVMDISWQLGLQNTSSELDRLLLNLPSFPAFHQKRHQRQNTLPEGPVLERHAGVGLVRPASFAPGKTRGDWFRR